MPDPTEPDPTEPARGVALVTGASRGIGRAVALELHDRGWTVVATARDPRTLADLPVAETGPLDVTDDASVAAAGRRWPQVDVLVNNAGIGAAGPVESTPVRVAEEIYQVNVLGTLRTISAFTPGMRARRRGTIVTLSSLVGRVGLPLAGVYASSKWALEGLSEALALELGHFGVHVVLVEPGVVSTGAFEAFVPYFPDDDGYLPLAAHAQAQPPAAASSPEEVARAVADTLDVDAPPLRVRVGAATEQLLTARASLDDAAFGKLVRTAFTPDDW